MLTLRINFHKANIADASKFLDLINKMPQIDGNSMIDSIQAAILHKTDADNSLFDLYLDTDEYQDNPQLIDVFVKWNQNHTAKINYEFINADIGCAYNMPVEAVECGLRIAADGNVFPCQSFTDSKYSFGNIKESKLNEVLESDKFRQFVELVHNRRNNLEQCKECGFSLICAGGCPAQAIVEHGYINSVSDRCVVRKKYLKESILKIEKIKELDNVKRNGSLAID